MHPWVQKSYPVLGPGVWRKAPRALPDSNSALDQFQALSISTSFSQSDSALDFRRKRPPKGSLGKRQEQPFAALFPVPPPLRQRFCQRPLLSQPSCHGKLAPIHVLHRSIAYHRAPENSKLLDLGIQRYPRARPKFRHCT